LKYKVKDEISGKFEEYIKISQYFYDLSSMKKRKKEMNLKKQNRYKY